MSFQIFNDSGWRVSGYGIQAPYDQLRYLPWSSAVVSAIEHARLQVVGDARQDLGATGVLQNNMHITARKEQFNYAYVGALAAQAGINSSKPSVDNDSVDITFTGKDYTGLIRDPTVNFQLKCTHQEMRVGENIRFPLSRKNYDDLRDTRLGVPRYLAVLEVPENCDDWTQHLDEGMLMKHRCYWASLRGLPLVHQDTITVSVPLAQRLTSVSLVYLLTLASNLEHV